MNTQDFTLTRSEHPEVSSMPSIIQARHLRILAVMVGFSVILFLNWKIAAALIGVAAIYKLVKQVSSWMDFYSVDFSDDFHFEIEDELWD